MSALCKTCHKPITQGNGKRPKKYCGIKCFPSKQLDATKARKKSGPKPVLDPIKCVNCGKEMQCKPSEIKRGKKTCSRSCYRQYLSKRFDQFIESPVKFDAMKNFDEYLTGDKLKCLVEGCDWEGHNLSLHVNLHHGIKARDFKRATGFNLTSSLISLPTRKAMEARGNKGTRETLNQPLAISRPRHEYISLESREHQKKAQMMRHANKTKEEE